MPTETTYTSARAHFAALCTQVATSGDVVIIRRRGADDVALVAAAELRGLMETAHLFRSPKNAQRLLRSLSRARRRTGHSKSMRDLRRELGLAS